jgi:hypothetical protein
MQLEQSFFAKYADVSADGLFHVIGGGLSTIHAAEFPSTCSTLAFVARVVFDSENEIRGATLAFRVSGPNGEIVTAPLPEPFADPNKLVRTSSGQVAAHIAINLVNLPVTSEGTLKFELEVGGRRIGHADISVIKKRTD